MALKKVDGRALCPQNFGSVVEVTSRLRDRPLAVVVELLVLVTCDDMPGLERRDSVDRFTPGCEPSYNNAFPEIEVSAVVNHVPGDNQSEVRNMEHAVVVGVPVADLHDHQVVSFERETLPRTVTAVTGDGGIAG